MEKIFIAFLLLALAVPGHAQQKQFRQEQIMGRNNKPLYESSIYLSPHYENSFFDLTLLQLYKEKAGKYTFSFIVTEKGELGSIVVDPALSEKARTTLLQKLKISSGNWTPAVLCGTPVQTLVSYSFRYGGIQ